MDESLQRFTLLLRSTRAPQMHSQSGRYYEYYHGFIATMKPDAFLKHKVTCVDLDTIQQKHRLHCFATNDAEPKSIYMDIITSLRMELA